jgi:hypothetical protein
MVMMLWFEKGRVFRLAVAGSIFSCALTRFGEAALFFVNEWSLYAVVALLRVDGRGGMRTGGAQ